MDPQVAIDLGRDAMKACFLVGGPILLASLVIGLLIGVLQAMTQVQDQAVSFVPKLICMMLVIGLGLPWLSAQMIEFSREMLATPLTHLTTARRVPPTVKVSTRIQPESADQAVIGKPIVLPHGETRAPEPNAPVKSPFQLPHFRFSKLPAANVGG